MRLAPHERHRRSLAAVVPAFLAGALVAVVLRLYLVFEVPHLQLHPTAGLPSHLGNVTAIGEGSTAASVAAAAAGGAATAAGAAGGTAAAAGGFRGLESVRGVPLLFVTFGNAAVFHFMQNWSKSVQRLGIPHFITAFDKQTASLCAAAGLPHALLAEGGLSSQFFRANLTVFRSMGVLKVSLVTALLEGYKVQTLVVSDTDTVWMRDPSPYLDAHPLADWFISTDCLSPTFEDAADPKLRNANPRCGHVPGSTWGKALNTGVFALRNRPATLATLRRWLFFMTDPEHAIMKWSASSQSVITDQLALNLVLEEGHQAATSVDPAEPRTIWQANHMLRLHPLNATLFPGGHVAFVQRAPWKRGVEPYVAHTTFQRLTYNFQPSGKRARFREFGMWLLDGPDYYAGRFLAYDNDVLQFVGRMTARSRGGVMPPLYKHWLAVSYQQALFHEALAVAAMTNRTVVLPQSWCWCDYDHVPHVLETCHLRGADASLPFPCPADYVFQVAFMDWQEGLDYRVNNFLALPQIPVSVRSSRAVAKVLHEEKPAALPAAPAGEAVLWLGIAEQALREQLRGVDGAAVLELKGLYPGLVGAFASADAARRLDVIYQNVSREDFWCCAGVRMRTDKYVFLYDRPRPYAAPWRPWAPPALAEPPYCAGEDVTQENLEYIRYANHPCQFLRNETAWALAASYERMERDPWGATTSDRWTSGGS